MGDFNANDRNQMSWGEKAVGNFGTLARNDRGETLVEFAKRNNLNIMNAFLKKSN